MINFYKELFDFPIDDNPKFLKRANFKGRIIVFWESYHIQTN